MKRHDKDIRKKYERNCPKCNKILNYCSLRNLIRANKYNALCKSCSNKISMNRPEILLKRHNAMLGDLNPAKRDDVKKKISNHFKGKRQTYIQKNNTKLAMNRPEVKRKCSISAKLRKSNKCGKFIRSDETRKKLRLIRIQQIQNSILDGGQIHPSYNKNSCKIIDEYGKNNGYKFQHALNGGEFYIKELGYWVDGYDAIKNVVIEYYEKWHKRKTRHDERRKSEIIGHLKCKFIEIKDW